eukprot:7380606-Prymnesium_polylepis.1
MRPSPVHSRFSQNAGTAPIRCQSSAADQSCGRFPVRCRTPASKSTNTPSRSQNTVHAALMVVLRRSGAGRVSDSAQRARKQPLVTRIV